MLLIVFCVMMCLVLMVMDRKVFHNAIAFNFKYYLFYVMVSLTAIFVIPIFCVFNRGDCVNSQRVSVLLRQYTHVLGIEWELRGNKELLGSSSGGCVVVVNHQSSLDILGLFWIWRYFNRMAAVARKEVFYVWPFGLSAYLAGVVFIDRGDTRKAKKQLQEASKMMHEDGTKLLLFPEGTRNTERSIGDFKRGAFHMAVSCAVPVLPLVISPYFFINPRKGFFGRGRVVIEALPLVQGGQDVNTLTAHVRELMAHKYQQLHDELIKDYPEDYPGMF